MRNLSFVFSSGSQLEPGCEPHIWSALRTDHATFVTEHEHFQLVLPKFGSLCLQSFSANRERNIRSFQGSESNERITFDLGWISEFSVCRANSIRQEFNAQELFRKLRTHLAFEFNLELQFSSQFAVLHHVLNYTSATLFQMRKKEQQQNSNLSHSSSTFCEIATKRIGREGDMLALK